MRGVRVLGGRNQSTRQRPGKWKEMGGCIIKKRQGDDTFVGKESERFFKTNRAQLMRLNGRWENLERKREIIGGG